jgi:hypothetical protein
MPHPATYRWAHKPSPFAWSVMCYGGQCPRTGFDQPQLEVQFHKCTRPGGFGLTREGILYRANDYAQMQHRSHFAVRDTDGIVIYDGPVLDEIELPGVIGRLSDAELLPLAKGQRAFERSGLAREIA